jgi:hypothetical protein
VRKRAPACPPYDGSGGFSVPPIIQPTELRRCRHKRPRSNRLERCLHRRRLLFSRSQARSEFIVCTIHTGQRNISLVFPLRQLSSLGLKYSSERPPSYFYIKISGDTDVETALTFLTLADRKRKRAYNYRRRCLIFSKIFSVFRVRNGVLNSKYSSHNQGVWDTLEGFGGK